MLKVNAMGDTCPIPVVKTKDAIRQLGADGGVVETLVDNEIAVQNLTKMANQKGYGVESEKPTCPPRMRRPCAPFPPGRKTPSWWWRPTTWARARASWVKTC